MDYKVKQEAPVSRAVEYSEEVFTMLVQNFSEEAIADFYAQLRIKIVEHLKYRVQEEQNVIEARNKAIVDLVRVIDFIKNNQ